MNYSQRYEAPQIFSEHLNYAMRFAEPLYPIAFAYGNTKQSGRRLKIGYLSPDFRCHSVAYFIEPVIGAHDREGYEVFCYSDVAKPDEVTARIRGLADQWRDVSPLPDERIADLIRSDEIDILVDLAGHTAKNRLLVFARKPAPLQVSWIGYPSTTGLKTVDYKIVDQYTDPAGFSEQYYTEQLVRLPDCFLCYQPDREAPDIKPLPAMKNGFITFGSFNNLAKVSEDIAITWAEILKAEPSSRLIIKAKGLISERARKNVGEFFRRQGIAENRIKLHPPIPSVAKHLAFYSRIDVALDTFPYNGATTTCEALYMGVPVVTLAGNTHASRVGSSILRNLGLHDLIAESNDTYESIAKRFTDNVKHLLELRDSLRGMMTRSLLTDAKRFTGNLEKAYRDMWTQWCNKG
jgi:predicted O-linked N-acetylglucosamine transferase (SPINDLY family)